VVKEPGLGKRPISYKIEWPKGVFGLEVLEGFFQTHPGEI